MFIFIYKKKITFFDINRFIYFIEQFFETSALYNQNKCYVSPSLAVSHPNVNKEFEIDSQWISTCAGIFKKSLFKKYFFPKQFLHQLQTSLVEIYFWHFRAIDPKKEA